MLTTDTLHSVRLGSARVHVISSRLARLRMTTNTVTTVSMPRQLGVVDDTETEETSTEKVSAEAQPLDPTHIEKGTADLDVNPATANIAGVFKDPTTAGDEGEPVVFGKRR